MCLKLKVPKVPKIYNGGDTLQFTLVTLAHFRHFSSLFILDLLDSYTFNFPVLGGGYCEF